MQKRMRWPLLGILVSLTFFSGFSADVTAQTARRLTPMTPGDDFVSWPAASRTVAAKQGGFVVRPDQVSRFSGPSGMEGLITEVLATRERTSGALGIWRYEIEPKGGTPSHIHRGEDQFFYVVSGEFHFQLGERMLPAPAGSFVFIPRGVVHTYQNTGSKLGVLLEGVTPAGSEGHSME